MTNPKDHSTRKSADHTTPEPLKHARKELENDQPQQETTRERIIERRARWDLRRGLIARIDTAIDAAQRRAYLSILRDLEASQRRETRKAPRSYCHA